MLYYTILDYLQRLVAMRELLKKSTFVPAKGTVAHVGLPPTASVREFSKL